MNDRMRDAMWVVRSLGSSPAYDPTHADIAALAERLRKRRLVAGRVLFREGEIPQGVWVISSGAVELAVQAGAARRVIQVLRGGDTVGDPYLLLDIAPPCTARTIAEAECFFITGEHFKTLVQTQAGLCALWLENLASRVVQSRTACSRSSAATCAREWPGY
jgi:CRP-like cAMP-binding protein